MIYTLENNTQIQLDEKDHYWFDTYYSLKVNKAGHISCIPKDRDCKKLGLRSGTLHRLIADPPKSKEWEVIHKDGNKFNCQRDNLEVVYKHWDYKESEDMDQDNKYFAMESEIQKLKEEVQEWKSNFVEKSKELTQCRIELDEVRNSLHKYQNAFTTLVEELASKKA
jgi:hypothetical protein